MSQEEAIFPILKQSADIEKYAVYLEYVKLILVVLVVLVALQLLYQLIRRYYLPRYQVQHAEREFFLALAHAFDLEEDEVELLQRQVQAQKLTEPHLLFCSARVFDPCLSKEIDHIQKKRMLSDEKKGHELDRIYLIRRKIFA